MRSEPKDGDRRLPWAGIALFAALSVAGLVMPAAGRADHVTANPEVSAHGEPGTDTSWTVVVSWAVNCSVGGGNYYGNLYLINAVTRESIYMGGVSGESGTARQSVSRGGTIRRWYPLLKISCSSGPPELHGSPIYEVSGNTVLIPARGHKRGDRGRGGGDRGGGRDKPPEPPEPPETPSSPLRPGGCAHELRGTNGDDELDGGGGNDLILGLGGDDVIRARGGHDCLIGHAGADRLIGGAGWDRLTGGSGADLLIGGPGTNRYSGGGGADIVRAANGRREIVRCGPGRDRASVDRSDRTEGCEVVRVSG